jgi:hypothetical protein
MNPSLVYVKAHQHTTVMATIRIVEKKIGYAAYVTYTSHPVSHLHFERIWDGNLQNTTNAQPHTQDPYKSSPWY